MKIATLVGFLSLFGVGESFFVSQTVESVRREGQRARLPERRLNTEDYDTTRRNYLMNALICSVSLTVTVQPSLAISASSVSGSDSGMATTKNKKIGGLALKIRSVGHIMVREHYVFC